VTNKRYCQQVINIKLKPQQTIVKQLAGCFKLIYTQKIVMIRRGPRVIFVKRFHNKKLSTNN